MAFSPSTAAKPPDLTSTTEIIGTASASCRFVRPVLHCILVFPSSILHSASFGSSRLRFWLLAPCGPRQPGTSGKSCVPIPLSAFRSASTYPTLVSSILHSVRFRPRSSLGAFASLPPILRRGICTHTHTRLRIRTLPPWTTYLPTCRPLRFSAPLPGPLFCMTSSASLATTSLQPPNITRRHFKSALSA